jgi:hypothetical protein
MDVGDVMKKWILPFCLISAMIVLIAFGMFIYQETRFSIEENALEKHITTQVTRDGAMEAKIEIEEIKDIGNFKTLLFSVQDEDMPHPNLGLGFAFYEKNWFGDKYRFDGMGWGSNTFDSYLFEAFVENQKQKFIVVYGRNPSERKEFERFIVNFHDEIFVANISKDEYFVEVFPVTNNSEASTTSNINFETADLYIESYPLIITSKIK